MEESAAIPSERSLDSGGALRFLDEEEEEEDEDDVDDETFSDFFSPTRFPLPA